MEIQEESPLPTRPLEGLEDDYKFAVLHIAWDWHRGTDDVTLLFAFVELIPAEIPPPIEDYNYRAPHCSCSLGKNSNHNVYVRHAVVSARQALDWYQACRAGSALLPKDDGTIPAVDNLSYKLKLASLGEEPAWPTLTSAFDEGDSIPFVPQWIVCPRTHHLLPLADLDLAQIWSEDERKKAQHWLHGRLQFDFDDYPEYWGSVHLIAPNPVYRRISSRLQPRSAPSESVLLRFHPRASKSVAGLELLFSEKEPYGLTAFRRVTVRGPLVRINFDREINSTSKDVWDCRRGFLLASTYGSVFVKNIPLGVGLAQTYKIRGPQSTYEVTKTGKAETMAIGAAGERIPNARSRLLGAFYARKKRRSAEEHGQQWFRGQKDEARDLLRSLLNEADESILLIDPYFGPEELAEVMLTVGRYDTTIRILASGKGLKETASKVDEAEKGDQLSALVAQLNSEKGLNRFEIQVMPGDNPAIHDRFLAIDKHVWLLGSSLHDFGLRGTMMLTLPDPDAVRDDLQKAWNESEPLDEWIERRRRNRNMGEGKPNER
jgi:hypothetical protein